MRGAKAKSVLGTSVMVVVVAGCSSGGQTYGASSPVFEGLDSSVTAEVLANHEALDRIKMTTKDHRDSLAQGVVENFVECRSAYRAYKSWILSGQQPELDPAPRPSNPKEPSHADMLVTHKLVQDAIDSGDPGSLRSYLLNESGCGVWIPVEKSGQTIAEAVKALP